MKKPKVFISHSWEDSDVSRKVAEYLKRDVVEIWIDYSKILGGDNLPEAIGNGVQWCDTMVLMWSKFANDSHFVKLEWSIALTNEKIIIPCVLDDTKLPFSLSALLYIDFKNLENGYRNLARALRIRTKEAPQLIKNKTVDPFCLGIDFGTNSSCVAGGYVASNIELVKFYDKIIIPSLVTFDHAFKIKDRETVISRYSNGIACGFDAELAMQTNIGRTFYSAKKSIGYNIIRELLFDAQKFCVSGHDITKVFIDFLVKGANHYFTKDKNRVKINKAVVAIPNNFTPLKINKMVEAVKNLPEIKEVFYIYEAEAVVLYYLSNYNSLNAAGYKKISNDIKENIFIFDFGGGSLDVSIIGLHRNKSNKKNIELEILARLGYSIGGDNIDRIIAEIFWSKLGEPTKFLPNPFESSSELSKKISEADLYDWWRVRLRLKEISENIKIRLSKEEKLNGEKDDLDNISNDKIYFNAKDFFRIHGLSKKTIDIINRFSEKKFSIDLKEIMNNEEMKRIFICLDEAIQSVFDIYKGHDSDVVHTVIFSGRSSFFPKIRQKIKSKFEILQIIKPFYIESLSDEEVKVAVAQGAAYYGIEQDNIILTKNKTMANYGYLIINPTHYRADTFRNVIPINTVFNEEDDKVIGKDKDQRVKHNNRLIRFYQVYSEKSKAQEIINKGEKEKYNQIAAIRIASDLIRHLNLIITSQDIFEGEVDDGYGIIPFKADIEINDILDDYDKEYIWPLD